MPFRNKRDLGYTGERANPAPELHAFAPCATLVLKALRYASLGAWADSQEYQQGLQMRWFEVLECLGQDQACLQRQIPLCKTVGKGTADKCKRV